MTESQFGFPPHPDDVRTTIIVDGDDDRWAFAEQPDRTWKLYERTSDDRIWTEVAGAWVGTYEQAIGERDDRVKDETETRRAELLND